MPAGARGCRLAEDPFQQLPLKQPIGLRRELECPVREFQALAARPVRAGSSSICCCRLVQLFHIARLGELGQGFHIDDADLRRLRPLLPVA